MVLHPTIGIFCYVSYTKQVITNLWAYKLLARPFVWEPTDSLSEMALGLAQNLPIAKKFRSISTCSGYGSIYIYIFFFFFIFAGHLFKENGSYI